MSEERLLSLSQLTAWMADHGVVRGKAEWARRARAGQFGRKVGTQWVATESEALSLLETLRPKDS